MTFEKIYSMVEDNGFNNVLKVIALLCKKANIENKNNLLEELNYIEELSDVKFLYTNKLYFVYDVDEEQEVINNYRASAIDCLKEEIPSCYHNYINFDSFGEDSCSSLEDIYNCVDTQVIDTEDYNEVFYICNND